MTPFFFLVLLFLNIFQEAFIGLGFGYAVYSDELLLGYAITLILVNALHRKRASSFALSIGGCAGVLLIISIINPHNSLGAMALQVIIHLKFFIYLAALCLLVRRGQITRKMLVSLIWLVFGASLLGLVLNLVFQDRFITFLGGKIQERGGALRLQGFQLKPNDLAIVAACYLFYSAFKTRILPTSRRLMCFVAIGALVILLNGSRTALVAVPLVLAVYAFESKRLGRTTVVVLCLCIPALYFFQDGFSYAISETSRNLSEGSNIKSSLYIRGIMIYYSFVLAYQYFPIGSGAASFGSVLSKGSPIYDQLGIGNLSFFQNMDGVYDSNLASILGEFGAVGLIVFAVLLWKTYGILKQAPRDLRVASLLGFIVFSSATNPVFFYQHNATVFAITLVLISEARNCENISRRPKL